MSKKVINQLLFLLVSVYVVSKVVRFVLKRKLFLFCSIRKETCVYFLYFIFTKHL